MHLSQIPAGCPQRFPDIRHCVQPDNINPVVAQEQHVLRHVVEHRGVGVVQIPLIGIEGRHDDLLCFLAPGKVPRRRGWKHLRHRLVVPVRNTPVIVEEIPVLEFLLPGPRPARPFMVLAGVVHHKVQAERNAAFMAVRRQFRQVLHRPQFRLNLTEIAHRVAAVAAPLRTFQQRHQVQVIDSAFRDVVKLFPDALQIPRERLHIHQHADHLMALIPVRAFFPGPVHHFQFFRPLQPHAIQHLGKVVVGTHIIVIQFAVQPFQLVRVQAVPD